jgi:CheY-like chemotaxis protein
MFYTSASMLRLSHPSATFKRARALSVLFIGDDKQPEFANVPRLLSGASVLHLSTKNVETLWAQGPLAVDLILMGQSRPASISESILRILRHRFPLTPVVMLLGSWCEGEVRSGTPPPGVYRLYWHQWASFWAEQTARVKRGLVPAWALPPTATEAEKLLARASAPLSAAAAGRVVIESDHSGMRDLLHDALRRHGWLVVETGAETTAPIDLGIWDAAEVDDAALARLRHFKTRVGVNRIIALVGFPRHDQHEALRRRGVDLVLSKPFFVAELLGNAACLCRLA